MMRMGILLGRPGLTDTQRERERERETEQEHKTIDRLTAKERDCKNRLTLSCLFFAEGLDNFSKNTSIPCSEKRQAFSKFITIISP